MKVYLVWLECFDAIELTTQSILCGIFAHADEAVKARKDYVAKEIEQAPKLGCDTELTKDSDGNPVVIMLLNGSDFETRTYSIEEWTVK